MVLPGTLTFNEYCSVPERAFGLAHSSLKILLETPLISDNPHTPTTSSHRGLDDDWVPVLIDKIGGLVI